MNIVLLRKTTAALAVSLLGSALALAAPYTSGSRIETFQAKDQHENAFVFKPAETRFLLVSHDMETGKKANAALTSLGKDFLKEKKAVYMANIHGMPGIGRMFAMPKMKKYNHRIVLGEDATLVARFPQEPGKVTILALKKGKVNSVKYWAPGNEDVGIYLK